jgi:hypothetical protein
MLLSGAYTQDRDSLGAFWSDIFDVRKAMLMH